MKLLKVARIAWGVVQAAGGVLGAAAHIARAVAKVETWALKVAGRKAVKVLTPRPGRGILPGQKADGYNLAGGVTAREREVEGMDDIDMGNISQADFFRALAVVLLYVVTRYGSKLFGGGTDKAAAKAVK